MRHRKSVRPIVVRNIPVALSHVQNEARQSVGFDVEAFDEAQIFHHFQYEARRFFR